MKKKNRKTLSNKLDSLWSQYIRRHGVCDLCGRGGSLDAHHVEHRIPLTLRWSLDNGVALCFRCHRLGVHSPASSIQAEFREKLTKLKGEKTMEELKQMRFRIEKVRDSDIQERIDTIKYLLQDEIF